MFKRDNNWDSGFFKKLSPNDTSKKNNQSGPLIPINIQQFLPSISERPTYERPAVSIGLTAELWINETGTNTIPIRYQIQSWPTIQRKNGDFKQEKRITNNLKQLLAQSEPADYLVFQRSLKSAIHYKISLIKKEHPLYTHLSNFNYTSGVVNKNDLPDSFAHERTEIIKLEIDSESSSNFNPIEKNPKLVTTTFSEYCRESRFRERLLDLYDFKCAICADSLVTPTGLMGLDAAHIIPRGLAGVNDPRNGIIFCKSHHWAFDKGLFWINSDYQIIVPHEVRQIKANTKLTKYHTHYLHPSKDINLMPDRRALEWHYKNIAYGTE